MNDLAKQTVLQMKYARIIVLLAEILHIDNVTAMDVFYNSQTLKLIEDGVADLHCRSDYYLAEEIAREYREL